MTVFKNTAAFNAQLWHVKHLLELRPLTFPHGEPTVDDVNYIEVRALCVVILQLGECLRTHI